MPKRELGMSLFRLVMEFKQRVEMETKYDTKSVMCIRVEFIWDLNKSGDGERE